jgi:hypothetical protein
VIAYRTRSCSRLTWLSCHLFRNAVAYATRFCRALGADLLNLVLGQRFDADQDVSRRTHPDQLIKLRLNRRPVPVLRVLNNENHQERNDGCAGVDNELPRVGEAK